MLTERPYFMTNKDWWKYDEELDMIILSKKAPKTTKIKNSYREYVKQHNIGKMTRGGCEMNFDVDDDKQFENFMNKIMKD